MSQPEVVVIGSANIDLVVAAERFPRPGETLQAESFGIFAGGKGANQAAAAARSGASTRLVAKVGDDAFGPVLRAALTEAGVDLRNLTTAAGGTGTALITRAHGGENTILIAPGANALLQPDDIDRVWPDLRGARLVLVQLEIPLGTIEHVAELCHAAGIPLILDPAPVRPLTPELLRRVTWLTPNEAETLGLAGTDIAAADESLLRSVAQQLQAMGPANIVLKLGSRGAFVLYGHDGRWIQPFPVQATDTTAAGDAFNGAFAAALAHGQPPFAAATWACAAAALSTTRAGAIPSLPAADAVDASLLSSGRA